jgi:hypothetical protein
MGAVASASKTLNVTAQASQMTRNFSNYFERTSIPHYLCHRALCLQSRPHQVNRGCLDNARGFVSIFEVAHPTNRSPNLGYRMGRKGHSLLGRPEAEVAHISAMAAYCGAEVATSQPWLHIVGPKWPHLSHGRILHHIQSPNVARSKKVTAKVSASNSTI